MKAILFLHPGREYSATANSIKEWTRGDHTRNFIKMAGAKFVDAGGKLQAGDIGFWGEWEAHATIEKDAAGHSVFSPYLGLYDKKVPEKQVLFDYMTFGHLKSAGSLYL